MKHKRWSSFIIVALVYILAAAAGIALYRALSFETWLSLLIADAAATVIVFSFSLIFGNASMYDPYWSVQPMVILAAFALNVRMTAPRILLLAAVCLWGLRLTANWAYTFRGLDHQDWRYTMLKEKTGGFYPFVNFTGIHMVPTLVVYGCILPAVYVFCNEAKMNAGVLVFFLVSVGAAVIQCAADCQMHNFQRSGKGGFIRTGLWKYSRHPNYLGEIMMWWGVGLAAVCAVGFRWYLLSGALANTLLFSFASIPMAEKHQARKAGFEEYRRQTNVLVPIGRKK